MRELKDDKGKPLEGFVADYLIPVAVEKNGKRKHLRKKLQKRNDLCYNLHSKQKKGDGKGRSV